MIAKPVASVFFFIVLGAVPELTEHLEKGLARRTASGKKREDV